MLTLAGVNDENLVELARQTGTKIALRGETLAISGNSEAVARTVPIAQRMIDTAKQQMPLTADDVLRMTIEGRRTAFVVKSRFLRELRYRIVRQVGEE